MKNNKNKTHINSIKYTDKKINQDFPNQDLHEVHTMYVLYDKDDQIINLGNKFFGQILKKNGKVTKLNNNQYSKLVNKKH